MASKLLGAYSIALQQLDLVTQTLEVYPDVDAKTLALSRQLFHTLKDVQSVEFEKEWARHYNIPLDDEET